MDQWIKSRIRELTDQRRAELQDFYKDQWSDGDGESIGEEIGLRYTESIIPEAVEKMRCVGEYDEYLLTVLLQINHKYYIWDLPRILEKIKDFFEPFIIRYNKDLEKKKQEYIDGWVANDLERDAGDIRNQAYQEHEKLCEED